jgi:hypothetical protein
LRAVVVAGSAQAADGQGAADGQFEVVGEHRRREPVRQGRTQNVAPLRACVNHDPVWSDLTDRREGGHVDDNTPRCLSLPTGGVALPAWDNSEVVRAGMLDHRADVSRVGGPQDGCRSVVNGVAVVVRGPRERVLIGVQTSGERGHGAERLVH